MIIFLLILIQITLGAIVFILWRCLLVPLYNEYEKQKLEALQLKWEEERKESRERAKQYNKPI